MTYAANYEIAFEVARRGLDNQERRVDELRSRSGTLVAAEAIATSFLGSEVLKSRDVDLIALLGFVFFLFSMVSTIWVLLPKKDWRFDSSPTTLIENWFEIGDPPTEREVWRKLALEWEGFWVGNQEKLDGLYWMFAWACFCLSLEIIFFGIALAAR